MNAPSEEILIQRQLRAAEIALDTARRRRFETDEVVRALQAEVADVEAALSVVIVAREQDRESAEARVQAAEAAQRLAEQRLLEERHRRLDLEQQISALHAEETRRDEISRELVAEARIRQLEGELELVHRRAAEFEYGVRMAAFDALKLVRDLADRVTTVLPGSRTSTPGGPASGVRDGAGAQNAADPGDGVDSQRLDAALDRLRASTPPPADGQ